MVIPRKGTLQLPANAVLILQICPKTLMCGLLSQGQTTDRGKTAAKYSLPKCGSTDIVLLCMCKSQAIQKSIFYSPRKNTVGKSVKQILKLEWLNQQYVCLAIVSDSQYLGSSI